MKETDKLFLISLLVIGLCFHSCEKENYSDLDILREEWDLVSIENNGVVFEKEDKNYFRENAYVLIFNTDSTFSLNTGVNYAGGRYINLNSQKITFSSYHEFTEVATTDKVEQQLINELILILPDVSEYAIQNENLTLIADYGKITFRIK